MLSNYDCEEFGSFCGFCGDGERKMEWIFRLEAKIGGKYWINSSNTKLKKRYSMKKKIWKFQKYVFSCLHNQVFLFGSSVVLFKILHRLRFGRCGLQITKWAFPIQSPKILLGQHDFDCDYQSACLKKEKKERN